MLAPRGQRGLIAINGELQGKSGAGREVALPGDDGLQQALSGRGGVAESLGRISSRIGDMADRAATQEGMNEGREAGLDPEFRTRQDLTLRGEAFDKAGLQVAETRLAGLLDAEMKTAWDKHNGSPAKLAQALDGATNAVMRNAPDELAPKLQLAAGSQRLAYMRDADRQQVARTRAEQSGALVEELARSQRSLHQRSYALGGDVEADKARADDLTAFKATLARKGIDGKPLIGPEQAARLYRGAEIETTNAAMMGAMDRLPTAEAKSAFVRQFEEDFAASKGPASTYDYSEFEAIRGRLETQMRRSFAEEKQGAAVVGKAIESIAKRAEKGVFPAPEELAAVKGLVATSRDPASAPLLEEAERVLQWQRGFSQLPLGQMEQVVQEMRRREQDPAVGATPKEMARRESAERMLSNATTQLKSNPLAWDDKVGNIKMQPLDPSTTETLVASGQVRVIQAEESAKRHGLAKATYLQPHEARSLSKAFAAGGEQGLAVAESITQAFGDRAGAVFEEIGKHGPVVARLGALVRDTGRSKGMVDAAEGLHLISIPGYKRLAPERSKTLNIVVAEAGSALAGFEDDVSAAAGVADLIYEKRALAARATVYDDRIWRAAFKEALGEHKVGTKTFGGAVSQGWFDGKSILLPGYVSKDNWSDVVKMITPADLEAVGLGKPTGRDKREIDLARVKNGRLIQMGDGQYGVSLSGGPQPDVARDGTGRPFTIDMRRLAPRLRLRRPDLFHGGEE